MNNKARYQDRSNSSMESITDDKREIVTRSEQIIERIFDDMVQTDSQNISYCRDSDSELVVLKESHEAKRLDDQHLDKSELSVLHPRIYNLNLSSRMEALDNMNRLPSGLLSMRTQSFIRLESD
jgi:hypothetical protein